MNFLLSKNALKLKHVNRLVTLSIRNNNGVSFSKVPLKHSSSLKSEVLPVLYNNMTQRFASAKRKPDNQSVIPQTKGKAGEISVGHKVKQAGKDATYGIVVIGGLCITGVMFYAIGRELFSSQSSGGVYSMAYNDCLNSTEITDVFGEPLKGYGEMTRRGRRRHVSHTEYEVDGVKYMRMKFYIEGPFRKGTVHLEVKQNESDKYEYRYLFVELADYPHRTIILQDNR